MAPYHCLARPRSRAPLVASVATALGIAGISLFATHEARADYYVRVVTPPPPPPPVYYYAPPPREPVHALAIGLDLEGAIPINIPQVNGNDLKGGGGFKIRVGDQFRVGRGVRLTPELGYAYDHMFANDDLGNVAYSWDMHRALAGVRLSFGRYLVPVIYAHLGYGWRGTSDPSVASVGGLAFDVGGALDLRVIPHVGFGAHIEYATIDAQPYTPEWIALGLHVDIIF